MKKRSVRVSRARIKERVKTIVLVLMFFSSAFLGYKIFNIYKEQAMAGGVRADLSTSANSSSITSDKSDLDVLKSLLSPECVAFGVDQGRVELKKNDEFVLASDDVNTIIFDVYKQKNYEVIDVESNAINKILKQNFVYIKYPFKRTPEHEEYFYDISGGDFVKNIEEYSEVFVVPTNDNVAELIILTKNNKAYKTRIESSGVASLKSLLNKYKDYKNRDFIFACELSEEMKEYAGAELAPNIRIYNEENISKVISIDVPKIYRVGQSYKKTNEFTAGLINIFGYNPNTVRQYISSDDVLIFVGETGNLSVYPEGKIEYKALGKAEGVVLSKNGLSNIREISTALYGIVEKVLRVSGVSAEGQKFDIQFNQKPIDMSDNVKMKISMDYFVDGKIVNISEIPSVYAVVENGILTELYMQVKQIDVQKIEDEAVNTLDAIKKYCQNDLNITKINKCEMNYKFIKNGEEINLNWDIQGE